jgi:ubiquitin-protein ligase
MSLNRRVLLELKTLQKSDELFVHIPDEKSNQIAVMFFGPPDSVYHHGIFLFHITIPSTYPFQVPVVQFITGGVIRTRIHPNLYQEGKVCLSILNTWATNEWSPLLTLEKVCLTIRALLDNEPLAHEPGFGGSSRKGQGTNVYQNYRVNATYYSFKSIVDMYQAYHQHPVFGSAIVGYLRTHGPAILDSVRFLEPYHQKALHTIHHRISLDVFGLKEKLEKVMVGLPKE